MQSLPAHTQFPPDWYDDPQTPGGRVKRFWDGSAWTDFVYDLGVDFAVPVPGPTEHNAASVTHLYSQPEPVELEVEVAEEVEVADETEVDRPEEAPVRKIRRFGARKIARQLAEENDELQRQVSELKETVARYKANLIQPGFAAES